MTRLEAYREQYPEYNDYTDYEVTKALYNKRYSHLASFEDFAKVFGGPTQETDSKTLEVRAYNERHPDAPIQREEVGEGSFLSDMGHSTLAGLNEFNSLPFWLAEKGSEAVGLDWLAEKSGNARKYYQNLAEAHRDVLSADQKLANEAEFFPKDKDGNMSLGDAWNRLPRKIGGMTAESLPSMVVGMGGGAVIAGNLIRLGVSRGLAWGIGGALGEGSVAGAQDSQDVYDTVMTMPGSKLEQSPEYQSYLEKTGNPDAARKALANDISLAVGLKTGAATAALSAGPSAMFGKLIGGEGGKSLWKNIGKQALAEGVLEEAPQSGAEHYLMQKELRRADSSINPVEGVGEAAMGGALAGAAMGGGLGALGHAGGRHARNSGEASKNVPGQNTLPSELEEQPFDMADSPSFAKADESFTVNPNAFTQGDPEHLPGGPALPAGRSLSALSLPEGTGAIRMGMDSSGRGPIAPPTAFSSPIAQGTSRGIIGLPESTQDTEHSGQWGGGRSQLSYEWGGKPSPLQAGLEGLKKSITGMSLAEAAQPAKTFRPSAEPESGFPVSLQQPVTASSIQQPAPSAPVQQGLAQRPVQNSPVPIQQPQPNPMPLPEPVGPQGMSLASAAVQRPVAQPQAQPMPVAAEQARPVMQPEQVVQPQPRKENEHGQEVQAQNEALLDARKAALPEREQVRARLSSMARKDLVEMLGGEPKAKRPVKKAELVEAILNRQFSVESAEAPLDESPVQGMVEAQKPETAPAQEAPHAGRGKVRDTGRNGGEGSNSEDGFLQGDRGGHGAAVRIMDDGGRGGDGGRPAQHAQEERAGRRAVAIKVPNRNDEPAHYELLESDEVRASHLPSAGFQKNPAYKLENERRYHDEPGSQAKVMENAAKLDPAFLMESVDANHGAPVIDHDNNVLGGNGRAMSIARAYESFPERGKQYREALKANADKLGIDPVQVDAMRSPVLVRRLERGMKPEERQQLVSAMNDDFKDAKEKRASGKSRGERFGRRTLDMLSAGLKDAESLREYFDTPASVAVVERMMEDGVIQRSERNALVGADGLLNPDGKKVVEEALRGRIARSYEALAKLPADVVGKLDAAIPHILVAEGIGKPWNITEHVRDSVDLLVGFKGSGVKEPDTYLKQVNMLTGRAPVQDFSKQAIALFRMALDAKKGEYVKAFEKYASNAKISPEAGGMPGVAKPQDKAFRDSFGMEEEVIWSKPEKVKEGKPQAKEESEGQPPEEKKNARKPLASLGDRRVVGAITKEMAATLRLNKPGDIILDAKGIEHIEERHGAEIRQAGFAGAREFVNHVLDTVSAIYATESSRKYDLVARASEKSGRVLVRLEFEQAGDFYRVMTAGPVRKKFYQNKTLLWESTPYNPSEKSEPVGTPRAVGGQSNVSVKKDSPSSPKVNDNKASITPGEFLPEAQASRLRVRKAAVQSVADALGKRAANAAETQVVQSFEELPESIKDFYSDVSNRLEGVYDPASGRVYLVADNLVSSARAAEVWMHENMVHHGINGLLGEREKVRLLNQMWKAMGGMGNPQIAAISKKYGLDPRSDTEGRALIMEEVLASLAEKRAADKLSGQDQTYWRRFVDAVLRAWHAVVDAVTGRTGSMKYENMDRLLSALDAFVFEGKPEGVEQGGMVPAMASKRSDPNNAHFSPDMGKKTDFVTLPDGSVDFAQFPATRLKDMRVLRAAPIRLERGVHSMEGGQGLRHIEANHGDEIRAAGYGSVQEFVWDLVNGYNEIWEGEGKSLLLLKNNGTDSRPAGFIELERNGSFYKVKNAYPVDRSYPTAATRKQLWKSAPPSSIATGEQSPSIPVSGHRNPFQDQTGNLQGQRGQSSKENIQQGREEGKPLASLGKKPEATPQMPIESFRSKIGGHKPTFAERFSEFRKNWKRKLEQEVFDHFASIKDVSKQGYLQARMTTSLGNQVESMIKYGAPVWKDGVMGVEGKSLQDIFSPVAAEMDSFLGWMVARRASRLAREGRERLFTPDEISAALKLKEGEMPDGKRRSEVYEKVFDDFAVFKKKVLDFSEQGGIINPDSRKVWENADYIPFYRVKEGMEQVRSARNKNGLAGQDAGIKRLTGSDEHVGDPLENIMRNFAHLVDAAQKNFAAKLILDDLYKAKLATKLSSGEVTAFRKMEQGYLDEAMKPAAESLPMPFSLTKAEQNALLDMPGQSGNTVSVQHKGVSYHFTVDDPLLFNALTGVWRQQGGNGAVMTVLRKMRRALTTGVTVMPDFIIRNFLRDTLHTWTIEHQSGFRPLASSLAQMHNVFKVDEDTKQLLAAGSAFMGSGYRLGSSSEEAAKALTRVLDKQGKDKKAFEAFVLDTPKKFANLAGKIWETYERAGSAAENAARLAVYKKLRDKGVSHREASFAAKDLMDFTMRGQNALVQFLCDTVPFLGARLAGLHRLGRGAMENPRAFALKGLTISLASMALYAVNAALHPDEWDALEDWEKDTYFHFWVGEEHFQLPKPFEVGFLFGTVPERIMEQLMTDKPGRVLAERIVSGVLEQLQFNPIPQAVRPLAEQWFNKDIFRDRPIVSQGMERKIPVEQYGQQTTATAKLVAQFMDTLLTPLAGKTGLDALRSPARLEHLVKGYLGGLGLFALGASDMVINKVSNAPDAPERRLEDYPVVGSFYRGSGPRRTRYESELYEIMRTGDALYSSLKQMAQEGEDAGKLQRELGPDDAAALAARKGLHAVTKEFAMLNKAMEKIKSSRNLSASEKKRELDNVQRRKNMLAQHTYKRIERMRETVRP